MQNTDEARQKKKKEFLKVLKSNLGIVTATCEKVGMSRRTFYNWIESDEDFKTSVQEIYDYQCDYVESQLFKKIQQGSEKSIHFYLKYKGKDRGYTNHIDITTGGDKISEIRLVEIKNDKNMEQENDS